MAFSNNFRLEKRYFEKLKSMIDVLKSYFDKEEDQKTKAILENGIDDNGAILLLYRNLGEAWAELSDLIKKAEEKIDANKEEADYYHNEINERIDEVNNYIMILIRELEERKQDKITDPEQYTTVAKRFDLFTDVTAEDEVSNSVNNNYGFYIRNTYMRAPDHIFDTPDAITLREMSIGPVDLEDYLAPIKAQMRNQNIAGIDILIRTSLIIIGADYLKYDVTNTVQIYNRPNVTDALAGGIILHSEPNRETFIDCSKFHGTQYYLQKRVSFNIIPQENTSGSINMNTLGTDYIIDIIPRLNQITWYEHKKINN